MSKNRRGREKKIILKQYAATPAESEIPVFKLFSESDFRGLFSEKPSFSAVSKVFSTGRAEQYVL